MIITVKTLLIKFVINLMCGMIAWFAHLHCRLQFLDNYDHWINQLHFRPDYPMNLFESIHKLHQEELYEDLLALVGKFYLDNIYYRVGELF